MACLLVEVCSIRQLLGRAALKRVIVFGVALADIVQIFFPGCRVAIGAVFSFFLGVLRFPNEEGEDMTSPPKMIANGKPILRIRLT
jgi:hypothetical protein